MNSNDREKMSHMKLIKARHFYDKVIAFQKFLPLNQGHCLNLNTEIHNWNNLHSTEITH